MRTVFLAMLAAGAAADTPTVWPVIEFNTAVTASPEVVADGMQAWGDLPNSAFVLFPPFMVNPDYRAYIVSGVIPAKTKITFRCPANIEEGDVCDFYVFVDHCPPCSLHGGLPGALLSTGWEAGSCAPRYRLSDAGEPHVMAIFRKQVPKGGQAAVVTASAGRLVGFAATPVSVVCSEIATDLVCNQEQFCVFENSVCVSRWCPSRHAAPTTCTVCADSEL
ncbi:hypothetical protein DIPPA_10402 [Diplonema papillatum]|nr:hypothetical protein DIPPA_10402 [Diplonema papillatum]